MYREMRRKDRKMDDARAVELLKSGEYGTLCTVGEDGQPYATPISYIVHDNKIYIHCALAGQKIDNMNYNSKVCFSVVGKTMPVYDKNFTTYFESVLVYGQASKVEDNAVKTKLLTILCEKYLPEHMGKAQTDIAKSLGVTNMYQISIDHITGKEKKMKNN